MSELEDIFGGESYKAFEVRCEVLVACRDVSVLLETTILQDVVESDGFFGGFTLGVEQGKAS